MPGGEHPFEVSELTALAAGIVASHQLSLEHESEIQASRTPSLRGIDRGGSVIPVDADVARRLPACTAVEKSVELSTQTYRSTADYGGCTDRAGQVHSEQVVTSADDGERITESLSLDVDGYAAPSITLSGQFERPRVFEADAGYNRVLAAQADVELTVTLDPRDDDGGSTATSWTMSLDHEVTMTPSPEGVEVLAEGTVELESGVGTFTLRGAWTPEVCASGGWASGTLVLERGGQVEELPLGCDQSSWEVARYVPATVQALRENPVFCEACSLADVELRHTFLAGAELEDLWLTDVDLTGATLFGASIGDAIVSGVDLTDADLSQARFKDSRLTETVYDRTSLVGTTFHEAHVLGADLSTARLYRTSFDEATVTGASFVGSDLSSVDIEEADLSGSDFTGAVLIDNNCEDTNFSDVDFTNAKLAGSNLHESVLRGARWANTICADGSNSDDNGGTCVDFW